MFPNHVVCQYFIYMVYYVYTSKHQIKGVTQNESVYYVDGCILFSSE
jgi:hypothetical protein